MPRDAAPFVYEKARQVASTTSYWRLPDAALDDREELEAWAGSRSRRRRRAKKPASEEAG